MSIAEIEIREWRIPTALERQRLARRREISEEEIVRRLTEEGQHMVEPREISEEEIERRLAGEGLIRIPATSEPQSGDFVRINVGGTPISETIIEERR
jgi:hypothetical protein